MELISLVFALIVLFASIGSIKTQWNSRSGANSTWQAHRGNYTGFPPNRVSTTPRYPYYANSSTPYSRAQPPRYNGYSSFTENPYRYITTTQPPFWAGGSSRYNESYDSNRTTDHGQRHNSSRLYPVLPDLNQEFGTSGRGGAWYPTRRSSDRMRSNSTRLYPSLEYFRGRYGIAQNGSSRPYDHENYGNSSYPVAQHYPR